MNRKSRRGGAPRRPASAIPLGTHLTPEAERLLVRLGDADAYAMPDPCAPDDLILRKGGAGISLGGGRFPSAAGAALVSAGLVEQEQGRERGHERSLGRRLVIAPAGRARLRRAAGPRTDSYVAQHLDLVADQPDGALRDASESPLAWLARRRGRDGRPLLDAASVEAGDRFRRDLERAAILPRITSDWGTPRVDGGGPRDRSAGSDAMLAARQRVDRALDAVGSDLAGLLIDLCGFLKGLERIEVERGWPARSGKVVVRMALGRLAEHYGLQREAVGPDRGRLRLWRAAIV